MRRLLLVLFASALSLLAANFKLYLKDGSFQLVREYKVAGDRVQFYSIERSDWEEIPVDLVDLKRTNAETEARQAELDRVDKELSEEEAAAREIRRNIQKIPQDPGVYQLSDDGQLSVIKEADASVRDEKGRNALKMLSPLPVLTRNATLEIAGLHSANVVRDNRPEFYFQLAQPESFAIVKLTAAHKDSRVVEKIAVIPVSKETEEDRVPVQTFTSQLSDNNLYKIWPQEPLDKGEYAVIEYTEGKVNARVWDFRVE
jgi:hypothetical protein